MLRGLAFALALAVAAGCTTPGSVMRCTGPSSCPAGRTCLDGICVASIDADLAECTADLDCRAGVPDCVVATCEEGRCALSADASRCPRGSCDLELGCVEAVDAGDASSADAGSIDAAPPLDARADAPLDAPADAPIDVRPDAPPGPVGAPCATASDCAAPGSSGAECLTTLSGTTFPGGYCSATCLAVTACGSGATCILFSGTTAHCMDTCTTAADCRTGYGCRRVGVFSSTDVCAPEGL